ncbi:MAG: tRNA 2-thiouridine(34) synthase MnmA [Spirochaetes bacterium]|nr:tRNA 2-thiouridine(34) synthase MnmA [Spirochaetota bacterium]
MTEKIAIGMSGGVDSSVAAFLLKKKGYTLTGFTLRLWDGGSRCCDLEDIRSAVRIASSLGIPHYVIDARKEFERVVVRPFVNEYLAGRTPNPCVVCNREIKFFFLMKQLKLLDCDLIATGHYARIIRHNNEYFLHRAKDQKKSQEYFLARVDKDILKNIIFPLGDLTKEQVTRISKKNKISIQREESQEVCFITERSYYDFILKNIKEQKDYSGKIIDQKNKILANHDCYFKYTIGQRQGLGISDRTPYYIMAIDAPNNNVIVGKREDMLKRKFTIKDPYWYKEFKGLTEKLEVKIRYNHKQASAKIKNENGLFAISFTRNQYAITPGQLAVFYKGDMVVGSGWIDRVL